MSEITPCQGCGASADCDQPNEFAYSLTSDPTLPFVLNCPAGFDCTQPLTLKLNCCHHILSASKAGNATNPQVSAILRALLIQCAQFNNQCAAVIPINNILQNTIFSSVGQCTIFCPDGTPFTFTTPQTLYLGLTQQEANLFAHQDACRLAPQHLICIGSLPASLPESVAFSQKLLATGFLAAFPQQNLWDITGDIPTGMTFNDGFFSTGDGPTLTGTPSASGPFTFNVKVTNPNGDSQNKDFTITVTAPPPVMVYFAFEQTSGNYIDSALGLTMPNTGFSSVPGLIAEGVTATTGFSEVSTGNSIPFNKSTSPGITMWFWMFLTASNPSIIGGVGLDFSGSPLFIEISNPSGTTCNGIVNATFASSTTAFTGIFGAWNLFTLVYDLSNHNLRLYHNTTLVSTTAFSGSPFATGNHNFGIILGGGPSLCDADEAGGVMNRVATTTQITSLFNGGAGVTWPAVKTIFS